MAAAARLDSSTTEGLQELEELTAFLLSPGLPSDIPDHPVGDCAPSAALQWHHGEVEPVIEMPSPSGSREDCLAAEVRRFEASLLSGLGVRLHPRKYSKTSVVLVFHDLL